MKKSAAIIRPLTDDEKEFARRRLKRRVAAMLVRAMAETDMTFEQIAERVGQKPDQARKYVHDLIDGVGTELNMISDICLALDCEPEFSMKRVEMRPASVPDKPAE